MGVPVYLFTGFLESGKSTVIKDTLLDEDFNTCEKTALFVCEEGEVEYDEAFLKQTNTLLFEIEDMEELNYPLMRQIACVHEVDRVIIEFNGMWSVESFLDEVEFPMDWVLVQILSTVDAQTFSLYVNNMRSLMYEQLKHSEMILFNRCDENTDKMYLRNNVKAFNKAAQLIYEDMQGQMSQITSEDLPFDLNQDTITIDDDDFGLWYMDAMENPNKYEGKTIILKAKVIHNYIKDVPRAFVMGRHAMVCCDDDLSLLGLLVHYSKASDLIKDDWVKVEAKLRIQYDEEYQQDVPVLYAKKVELQDGLQDEYVYFS